MKHKKLTNLVLTFGFAFCLLTLTPGGLYAEEGNPASAGLIDKAWEAHGKRDIENTFKYTQQVIDLYKDEADRLQASLTALPKNKDEIEQAAVLNNVATAYFIQAESLMRQEKLEEAKKIFKIIIEKYYYAQAWDQRGWYWQIAETSRQSIKKIETGSIEIEKKKKVSQIPTNIVLYDPGKEDFLVDYEKYGEFKNIGTKEYRYIVKDQEGLTAAVGEGIYPNTTSVRWDPEFKKAQKEKRLEASHWDLLQSPDLEAAFLKWATSSEPPGVKLFYTGLILEKSGLIKHAIKCYYAIVVHFPGSFGWTYWHTPWSVSQAAIAKINFLLRHNPSLGYRLVDADIRIVNGYDNDVSNDIVITNPGRFAKEGLLEKLTPKAPPSKESRRIKRRVGKGTVHLVQYANGHWQLLVNNKPYIIKGITYTPTKVGESPDEGTMTNWMEDDFNRNGRIDGPYDAFVDKNRNNLQDKDEPDVGDFHLMKEMGINTIRWYHQPFKANKELLRNLYKNYGIRVIMGDFLGKYALGSGATWYPGTDYNNEEHKKNMIESVTRMVLEFKDEPFILFWLLGNENVYGFACNANKEPDAYFKFVNEVAKAIKAIDPQHPVAICSGDTLFLDKFGKDCPDIDIFGTNAYRGDYGFGFLWRQVKEEADKPAFITEFGCPAYAEGRTPDEAEDLQAEYHRGAWEDIEDNMAFHGGGGNAIGGVAFEWLDEWWKAYEPSIHDTKGLFTGPFPDGYMHEEWLGVCSQGDGKLSPFLRQLRKSYYMYKKMWR
ncbi:MAG: glycoside hydrolase family 2 TIM barrel-domain containing protein [Candidatus Omnitrophota bacterium]|nr:glycoside hydrolase family 2 TIM barrel-domain containing protein [Candidatus Omnitrophota bacterium]